MSQDTVTKARPETVRLERVGSVFLKLKKWADGGFSIEISSGNKEDGYQNITFGVFEATGISDALMALTSLARK